MPALFMHSLDDSKSIIIFLSAANPTSMQGVAQGLPFFATNDLSLMSSVILVVINEVRSKGLEFVL